MRRSKPGSEMQRRARREWNGLVAQAHSSDPEEQWRLGAWLGAGRGVRRDQSEAIRWSKRAHREAETCATANLENIYRVQGNHRRPLFWYRRAAALGMEIRWWEWGGAYSAGVGVRRDPAQAVRCFRRAISQQDDY